MLTREHLATLSFLVMESLIFYAISLVLAGGAGGDGPAYLTVLLATLGGFGFARALRRFDISPVALALIGVGGTVLVLTILLNLQYNAGGNPLSFSWFSGFAESPDIYLQTRWPQTWGVIVVCAVWCRAVWCARQELSYGAVLTSFSIGLLIFVVLLIFGQSTHAGEWLNLAALPFFLSGVLTLALVQLRTAEATSGEAARGPWLQIVLGTVVALGIVSAILGLFPLGLMNRLLAPVGLLLLRIVDLVIYAIALPISWIATAILSLIVGRDVERPERINRFATDNAERLQEGGERSAVLGFLLVIFKALFVLAVVAIVAYVLYRIFRHLRRPSTRADDELRETIESEGGIGEDLNALFRGLLDRLRRSGGQGREPDLSPNARRVRRLYLDLLDDAEAHGTARPPPATPHEFAPDLTRAYSAPATSRLTDRFAAARYGRLEPAAEDVTALEREIDEVKKAGR